MDTLKFSEWLQTELNAKGWSQSELAHEARVNRQVISTYINQRRKKPDEDILRKIAHALGYPPETVFRAAGLLPPALPEIDDELKNLLSQVSLLSDRDKEEIKAIIRIKLKLSEPSGPPPVDPPKRKRGKAGAPDPALPA